MTTNVPIPPPEKPNGPREVFVANVAIVTAIAAAGMMICAWSLGFDWFSGDLPIPMGVFGCLLLLTGATTGVVALLSHTTAKKRAIAAILIFISLTIAYWPLRRAMDISDSINCHSWLHQIGHEMLLYQDDNNDTYPPDWQTLIKYIHKGEEPKHEHKCPAARGEPPHYFYHPPTSDAPEDTLVVAEIVGNHNGRRNVLYADGTVEELDEDAFKEALARPCNAAFAEAFRAAEAQPASQPTPTSQPAEND